MTEHACYRVATLAERWDCSTGKVRALIRTGALQALDLGGMVRIPASSVTAYEARCQMPVALASCASPDDGTGTPTGGAEISAIASARARRTALRRSDS